MSINNWFARDFRSLFAALGANDLNFFHHKCWVGAKLRSPESVLIDVRMWLIILRIKSFVILSTTLTIYTAIGRVRKRNERAFRRLIVRLVVALSWRDMTFNKPQSTQVKSSTFKAYVCILISKSPIEKHKNSLLFHFSIIYLKSFGSSSPSAPSRPGSWWFLIITNSALPFSLMKHLDRFRFLIFHLLFRFIISNSHLSPCGFIPFTRSSFQSAYQLMQLSEKCDNNIATYAATGHKHFVFTSRFFSTKSSRAMNSGRRNRNHHRREERNEILLCFSISNTWMIPSCDSPEPKSY